MDSNNSMEFIIYFSNPNIDIYKIISTDFLIMQSTSESISGSESNIHDWM